MRKKISGKTYLYLYKSKWVEGKPKSVFISYLGPENDFSEKSLKKEIARIEAEMKKKDDQSTV